MEILVAEDELVSSRLLSRTLEMLGHTANAFIDGAQALKAFEEHTYPVIVSDWTMPEMDGLDLCRAIRGLKRKGYTYFILLTAAEQSDANYTEAMDAGIDDFLTKPLDKDSIWMRLRVAERILSYTNQITTLEELLPICSYCKRVRNDQDYWEQVESYFTERTGSMFSHSICPSCYESVIKPQLAEMQEQAKKVGATCGGH